MHTEVCIFGGGPAGLAVAARLLEKGRSVVILDRALRRKPWGGESFTGAIRAPLLAMGCWDAFERAGHVPGYERQSAWGGPPQAESSMVQPHGPLWHVDRDRFDDDLRSSVLRKADILLGYRKLEFIARVSGVWRIVIDGATEVTANYVVDASGRARVVARKLKARIESNDGLLGLTAKAPRDAGPTVIRSMLIEATPFGWWYASPTPTGHVMAFFTDADLAPPDLRRRLRPVAANSAFTHVDSMQDWLAVGDACASHDPLCGWGVQRAMTNGLRAADAIDAFLPHGDRQLLEDYRLHVRREYQRYLQGLIQQYSIERRWPESPFWKRRHALLTT